MVWTFSVQNPLWPSSLSLHGWWVDNILSSRNETLTRFPAPQSLCAKSTDAYNGTALSVCLSNRWQSSRRVHHLSSVHNDKTNSKRKHVWTIQGGTQADVCRGAGSVQERELWAIPRGLCGSTALSGCWDVRLGEHSSEFLTRRLSRRALDFDRKIILELGRRQRGQGTGSKALTKLLPHILTVLLHKYAFLCYA